MTEQSEPIPSPPPVSLQYADAATKAPSKRGKGFLAIAGNVVLPGLGHILAGRYRRGAIWFGIIAMLNVLTLGAFWSPGLILMLPVVVPLTILVFFVALIDGYFSGRRSSKPLVVGAVYRYVLGILILIIAIGIQPNVRLALYARDRWCEAFLFTSTAMSPTIVPGDRFLVHKRIDLRRWDLAAFTPPPTVSTAKFLFRLVGLPGETVEIRSGVVRINGQPMPAPAGVGPYIVDSRTAARAVFAADGRPIVLGPDEFFVIGDNSAAAFDSRYWGPIKRSQIVGRATAIYWPPQRWRRIP